MSTLSYNPSRFLNAMSAGGGRPAEYNTVKPRMDLYEDPKDNLILAEIELPGFKKEDVTIDVQSRRLTITAEIKPPESIQERNYAIHERLQGKYSRNNYFTSRHQESGRRYQGIDGAWTSQDRILQVSSRDAAEEDIHSMRN